MFSENEIIPTEEQKNQFRQLISEKELLINRLNFISLQMELLGEKILRHEGIKDDDICLAIDAWNFTFSARKRQDIK